LVLAVVAVFGEDRLLRAIAAAIQQFLVLDLQQLPQ
jgi:hypothetical protein